MKLTNEELVLRFHGEPFSNKLCDELLSRLARVSELEAENTRLKQETYPGYKREKKIRCQLEKEVERLNRQIFKYKELAGSSDDKILDMLKEGALAIEKLERISKLPFRNDVAEILAEEG